MIQSHIALATEKDSCARNTPVSFDTDGIPFIIDNSARCIICNDQSLFTNLWAESFRAEPVPASVAQCCYAGTMCLELIDDCNETHVYEFPEAIYDPSTKFNLIGIPFCAAYFDDTNAPQATMLMLTGLQLNPVVVV